MCNKTFFEAYNPQPPVKLEQEIKTANNKANWISNIINVVKSPNKSAGDTKGTKCGHKSVEPAVDDCKSCVHDSASHRNRRESRLALRVERRMSRSSSLDTVSTCLSQESIKYPQNSVGSANYN